MSDTPHICEMHGLPYVEGKDFCEKCLSIFRGGKEPGAAKPPAPHPHPAPAKPAEAKPNLCKTHGLPVGYHNKCSRCWSDIQTKAYARKRAALATKEPIMTKPPIPEQRPTPVAKAAPKPKPAPAAPQITPRPSDGRGAGGEGHPAVGEGPRIVIEGTAAQRIVRLIQMHRVAGQLDPADADAVRDVVQRQAGLCVLENAR